jgi:hypothetical protein
MGMSTISITSALQNKKTKNKKQNKLKGRGILPWCTKGFVPGPFKKTSAGADSTPNLIRSRQDCVTNFTMCTNRWDHGNVLLH